MVINSCLTCEYHEIRVLEEPVSYCLKEGCWSRFSKCIARKAIESFLEQDRIQPIKPFSAIAHAYNKEV